MNFTKIFLMIFVLNIAACGNDDTASIEEAEAKQTDVNLVDVGGFKALDEVPITKELARDICLFELGHMQTNNNSLITKACECAANSVDLSALTETAEAKRKAGIPFESRGIVIAAVENEGLVSECFPFM